MGRDHMTISEFNVGHEAFVPFDKGALYESWPFQSRPKAPSVHTCQDRSTSDPICYNFLAIVDFMADHTSRIFHVIRGNVVMGHGSHLLRSGRQQKYTLTTQTLCQIIR